MVRETHPACGGTLSQYGDVSGYRFGIDDSAADRLRLVASAYEANSRPFLAANARPRPRVAVDLGCGPAFTTELLNEVCWPQRIVGIDTSEAFAAAARARLPRSRFEVHDVTELPLPGAPADLIYARLLLAHLPDPQAVTHRWPSQLTPGGKLLIEDLDGVINPSGPLHDFEDVSATVVRSGGGLMYAGAELADLGGMVRQVTVPGALAARVNLFNVRHWLEAPDHPVTDTQLRDLERGLVETSNDDHGVSVSWNVRQLVLGN
jgi:trans-aconitate 2-methyltransferase